MYISYLVICEVDVGMVTDLCCLGWCDDLCVDWMFVDLFWRTVVIWNMALVEVADGVCSFFFVAI